MSERLVMVGRQALLLSLAGVFVTLLSGTTSPYRPWFGGDSAMFRLIGSAAAQGRTLYTDIWDHKGPGLFLIQWLGQALIPGRLGIFLLQILLLYATLALLWLTARRIASEPVAWASVLGALAFLAPAYEHGNLSEEFSLPFIALVLLLLTREWAGAGDVARWHFAVAGGAFAYVVFLRINNALPIFAVFVAYFVWVLVAKRRFWLPLALSVGGFLAIAVVFIIGFAVAGALPQMIDGTFLFSLRYTGNEAIGPDRIFANGYVYVAMVAVLVPLAGGILDAQARQRWSFLLLGWVLAGCTAAALLLSSTGYFHYLQIGMPGIALGVALAFGALTGRLRWHVLALAIIVAVASLWTASDREGRAQLRADEPAYTAQVQDILDPVPLADRAAIYGWNVDARYYLNAGTLPVQRYFTMQEWWGSTDPAVLDEALAYVEEAQPQWIIATSVGEPRMRELLERHYQRWAENDRFVLYQRVEGAE